MTKEDLHEVARRGTVSDAKNLENSEKIFKEEGKIDELFSRNFGESLAQEERDAMKFSLHEEPARSGKYGRWG